MEKFSLVVGALGSPLHLGIYDACGILVERVVVEGKTSEVLALEVHKLFQKYSICEMLYTNGPGSFMSVKIAYVTLKTLSIALNIPLYACDGFAFNGNNPIKSIGKTAFIKKDGKISIFQNNATDFEPFSLPQKLQREIFLQDNEPLYVIAAVS